MDLFMSPPVGFHFLVVFELFPQTPNDFRFQEVSGLEVDMEMEQVKEGGQNRFTHNLPVRNRYYFKARYVYWFRYYIMVQERY
jgi:phage tail-like protein